MKPSHAPPWRLLLKLEPWSCSPELPSPCVMPGCVKGRGAAEKRVSYALWCDDRFPVRAWLLAALDETALSHAQE